MSLPCRFHPCFPHAHTVQIKERAEEPERENLRGWMHNSGCLTRRESRDSNPFPPSRCFEIAGLRTSKITSALNNPLWEWGGRARRGRGAARRVNCFDFTFKRLFANEGLSAAHQGRRPRHEASVGKQASSVREGERRPGNKILALARMLARPLHRGSGQRRLACARPTSLARETISPDNLALLPHINCLWEMH